MPLTRMFTAAAIAALAGAGPASAQTDFTYQGVLQSGGGPLTGTANIRFRLFDAEVDGTLFGESTQNVDVVDGVFSVPLSLGTLDTIDPSSAWLEIAVETGGGTFDVLGRQRLTAAPFAMNVRGIDVNAAERVSIDGEVAIGQRSFATLARMTIEGGESSDNAFIEFVDNVTKLGTWVVEGFGAPGGSAFTITEPGVAPRVTLRSGGKLGIGTTDPGRRLHVRGTDGVIRIDRSDSEPAIDFFDYDDSDDSFLSPPVANWYMGASQFGFGIADRSVGNVTRFWIDRSSTGNVGIGTQSPTRALDVRGSVRVGDGTTNSQDIDFFSQDGQWQVGTSSPLGAGGTDGNVFYIYDTSTTDYVLNVTKGSNRVGVGTLDPQAKLDAVGVTRGLRGVATASTGDARGVIGLSDSQAGVGVYGFATSSSGETVGVQGEVSSNIGAGVFGTTAVSGGNASGGAFVSGARFGYGVRAIATDTDDVNYGVWAASLSPNGYDFFAGGPGIDMGSSSSGRWKKNVTPVEDPLDKLDQIRGVRFDWDKEHGGHADIGFIAEEVGAIFPEIVHYEDNGVDAVAMDYSRVSVLLVEAVKELRAQHDSELTDLRSENDDLRVRLERLELMLNSYAQSSE